MVNHLGMNPRNGGTPPILKKLIITVIFNVLFLILNSWVIELMFIVFRVVIRIVVIME